MPCLATCCVIVPSYVAFSPDWSLLAAGDMLHRQTHLCSQECGRLTRLDTRPLGSAEAAAAGATAGVAGCALGWCWCCAGAVVPAAAGAPGVCAVGAAVAVFAAISESTMGSSPCMTGRHALDCECAFKDRLDNTFRAVTLLVPCLYVSAMPWYPTHHDCLGAGKCTQPTPTFFSALLWQTACSTRLQDWSFSLL
jgi:hypothetical protein